MDGLLQTVPSGGGGASGVSGDPNALQSLGTDVMSFLKDNENNPSIMYDNRPLSDYLPGDQQQAPAPPPVQQHQQAPAAQHQAPPQQQYHQQQQYQQAAQQQQADLYGRLQMVEAQNAQLSEAARVVQYYDEILSQNPELAEQFLAAIQGQQAPAPAERPAAVTDPNAPPQAPRRPAPPHPGMLLKRLEHAEFVAEDARLRSQAMELENRYPGVFNRQQVAQYASQRKIRDLDTAFQLMMGEATQRALWDQRMAQEQQRQQWFAAQMQGWQQQQAPQYPQMQQSAAGNPYYPQQHQQPSPDYARPAYVPMVTAPPAADQAVIGRPGARQSAPDAYDNYKPENWNQVHALMTHDMKKFLGTNRL